MTIDNGKGFSLFENNFGEIARYRKNGFETFVFQIDDDYDLFVTVPEREQLKGTANWMDADWEGRKAYPEAMQYIRDQKDVKFEILRYEH